MAKRSQRPDPDPATNEDGGGVAVTVTLPPGATAVDDPEGWAPDADAGLAEPGASTPVVRQIPIAAIDDADVHHRLAAKDEDQRVRELADSIEAIGQLSPVCVTGAGPAKYADGGAFRLVFGSRRLRALRLLERGLVRAEVRGPMTDAQVAQARAVENIQRRDLDDAEKCVAVLDGLAAMAGEADPAAALAARIGKPRKWVADYAFLQRLAQPVKQMVRAGQINAGQARELAKLGDPRVQKHLAQQVRCSAGGRFDARPLYTVEYVRELVDRCRKDLARVPWELDRPVAAKRACVGCPDNTATQPELFDTGRAAASGSAARGTCMNEGCFTAKWAAAEKAKAQTTASLKKAKQPPTAAEVDQRRPAWLKRAPAQAHARRNLPASVLNKGRTDAQKAAAAAAEKVRKTMPRTAAAKLTPQQQAESEFRAAEDAWLDRVIEGLERLFEGDAAAWVSWCVLSYAAGFTHLWVGPNKRREGLRLVALAHRGAIDPAKLAAVAKSARAGYAAELRELDAEQLAALGAALGIDAGERPKPPPEPKAANAPKRTARKAPGKKK